MSNIFRVRTPWRECILNYSPVGENMQRVGTCMLAHSSNISAEGPDDGNDKLSHAEERLSAENEGLIKGVW